MAAASVCAIVATAQQVLGITWEGKAEETVLLSNRVLIIEEMFLE